MSVWESAAEALAAYVYSDRATGGLPCGAAAGGSSGSPEAQAALWWIPRGHTPTTAEAEERLIHLRDVGPRTATAFTLKERFPHPGRRPAPARSAARKSGLCPV